MQGSLVWFDFPSSRYDWAASITKVDPLDAALLGTSFGVTVAW
jgi:hypothetical protein